MRLGLAAPRWSSASPQQGRIVQTSSLRGYLLLYAVAGLRRWRRGSLRFASRRPAHRGVAGADRARAPRRSRAGLEIAQCQRLVKGYSDTHERGLRNFDAADGGASAAPARAIAPATPARAARRRAGRRARPRRCGAALARAGADEARREPMSTATVASDALPRRPRRDPRPGRSPTACTATSTSTRDLRAGAGALLRQHLELRRPRQPAAERRATTSRSTSPAGRWSSVRHDDGSVRVLMNRCAHKGSRVVSAPAGNTGRFFRCPYHAWAYNTDGSLRAIPLKSGYDGTRLPECEAAQGPGAGRARARATAASSSPS